jgi:hypothetical protein
MNYRRNEDQLCYSPCNNAPAYSAAISCEFSNEGVDYGNIERFYYYTATGTEGRSWLLPELKDYFINGRLYRDGQQNDPSGTQTMNRQAIDVPGHAQYQWDNVEGRLTLSDDDPEASQNERFTIPYISGVNYFEPVSLEEAKAYLRIDASETAFDEELNIAITAARQEIEHYLNRSLINRTITAVLDIAGGWINLPYGPVDSILAISDMDNNVITADSYTFKQPVLMIGNYYRIICIYNTGGYTSGNPVAPVFKHGIKRLLAFDWQHKGDDGTVRSVGAITGLKMYRRVV